MALFHTTKLDKVCRDIAQDLVEYRAAGVDDAAFEAWVRRRVVAYSKKADVVQKRHIHLLCFWEASLGPDGFADLRANGLEDTLRSELKEVEKMRQAMKVFRCFLGADAE